MSYQTVFNATTGEYSQVVGDDEPVIEPETRTLEDVQSAHQAANCDALAVYLAAHPLLWTDGELYSVTEDDQQRMSLYFNTFSMGIREKLEWNSHTKKCREFTVDEFKQLSKKIDDFVEPRVKKCQEYKERIFAAQTIQEVEAITFDFDDV